MRVSSLGWSAIALMSLATAIMVLDTRRGGSTAIRRSLAVVVSPLHRLVEAPFALVSAISSVATTSTTLRERVATLEERARQDSLDLAKLKAVEAENQRLQRLLDASPRDTIRTLTGRVLQISLDPLRQRVLIDRGQTDGISSSQPVMDARGVFGQTTQVNGSTSEVILLSDPNHAIPVEIERNGLRTIAVGTGDPTRLALPYLPRNTDIRTGDRLLTSGLGGVYPPDLPVATVTDVRRDPSQPLVQVRAVPDAALDKDREVLVVWFKPRVQTPELTPKAAHTGKGKGP